MWHRLAQLCVTTRRRDRPATIFQNPHWGRRAKSVNIHELRIAQSQSKTIGRYVQYDTIAISDQDKHKSNLELNHASTALIGTSSGLTLPPALPISLLARLDALPPPFPHAPGIFNLSAPPLDATGNADIISAGGPLMLSGGLGRPSCSSFLMASVVRWW